MDIAFDVFDITIQHEIKFFFKKNTGLFEDILIEDYSLAIFGDKVWHNIPVRLNSELTIMVKP